MDSTILVTIVVCWAIYLLVKRGIHIGVKIELDTSDRDPVSSSVEARNIESFKEIMSHLTSDLDEEHEMVDRRNYTAVKRSRKIS